MLFNMETNEQLNPEESFQIQGVHNQSIVHLCILRQSSVQFQGQQVIVPYYEGHSVISFIKLALQVPNICLLYLVSSY